MDLVLLVDRLEDIADRLRVHLNASPLDDIVEYSLYDLQELITEIYEEGL